MTRPGLRDENDGKRRHGGIDHMAASQAEATPSIAVLPFVNMSTGPEVEYFADGLSEEILNRFAQVPWPPHTELSYPAKDW